MWPVYSQSIFGDVAEGINTRRCGGHRCSSGAWGQDYWQPRAIGPSISEAAAQAIANLAAISIEHARQQITLGRVEAARRNEQLRSILLDAVAHDFLTPLTSIKSAITTVRSEYVHDAEQEDFLAVVEEEADRLGEMVSEITDMARIEPGNPHIRRRQIAVPDLIHVSLRRMKPLLDGRPLDIQIEDGIPAVYAYPDMVGLALRQLLSNAVKYSPPEPPPSQQSM
jgi:two-component system sensor histidine kinase KdpD